MAWHYDKHFEIKNKWQNQQIAKTFKNNGHRYHWKGYVRNKTNKIHQFDMVDYELSLNYNPIPIWNCSYCTYTNIERKSHCHICNASYKASNQHNIAQLQTVSSKHKANITLGQFCTNILDTLSVPVWICSKCTYCNIEQLPKCQMCFNPYTSNQQSISNTPTQSETLQYIDTTDEKYMENEQEYFAENNEKIIPTNTINQKYQKSENEIDNQVKILITMKLITNKSYQKQKSIRLQSLNEDILRHTLLETKLEISTMNGQLIKSYLYLPAMKTYDTSFTSYGDTVIVPIKYKYRNSYGEFGYFCNNNPLKCIGAFIWESQYPYLEAIECPQWQFIYPQNKNVRSPVEKQYIFDSIFLFLPSKDIITCILFKLLGYDEMEIVKIKTNYSNTEYNTAYFRRYKIKHAEKEVFMLRHNGKLPFRLHSNQYSKIKRRKIENFLKLTEIGFNHSGEAAANNYWLSGQHKKVTRYYYGAAPSKYVAILQERYLNTNIRNRHKRKRARKQKQKQKTVVIDIKQFYPRKYLYFKHNGHGARQSYRKRRRQRCKARRMNKHCGYAFVYQWRAKQRETDPRYANKIVKWYLQKEKRYIERKWSAYWKLDVSNRKCALTIPKLSIIKSKKFP
eukprot:196384_1